MRYNGNLWGVMSGTSMAAPTVAGIIAQWLQINPNLSPGDIKNVIAETAIKDSFTQDPNTGYRFGPNGKIDAMAGARYLLAQMPDDVKYGDINNDDVVDTDDIALLIMYILGNEITVEYNKEAMDMNQNTTIDIDDIALLINKILAISW